MPPTGGRLSIGRPLREPERIGPLLREHFLAAQGCPLAQGLLFGDALPVSEMTARLCSG